MFNIYFILLTVLSSSLIISLTKNTITKIVKMKIGIKRILLLKDSIISKDIKLSYALLIPHAGHGKLNKDWNKHSFDDVLLKNINDEKIKKINPKFFNLLIKHH